MIGYIFGEAIRDNDIPQSIIIKIGYGWRPAPVRFCNTGEVCCFRKYRMLNGIIYTDGITQVDL